MEGSRLRCAAEVGRGVEADRRGRFRSLDGKRRETHSERSEASASLARHAFSRLRACAKKWA